ncbi:MAG TPA: hypothetical protein VHD62_10595 [Opitutaceae bacterium]|nr:hypothetical protein [Opitutaceae bacterium]
MSFAVRSLLALAAFCLLLGCHTQSPSVAATPPTATPLTSSPRVIVGRILAIDAAQKFAFVDLAPGAPPAAIAENAELTTRTPDLRETGRLRASRYLRGRTLGATIVAGQPAPGDEVVWLTPR